MAQVSNVDQTPTAGPLLVGIVLNWWLYGILCVQYYLYISKGTKDETRLLKFIVHFIFVLDTAQTCLMMEDSFYWFIYNHPVISDLHFAALDIILIDNIIAFTVQLVYCWRIFILSGWKSVTFFIAFCAFGAFGSGLFVTAVNYIGRNLSTFKPEFRAGVKIWLGTSAVTDLFIAAVTSFLLVRMNKRRVDSSGQMGTILMRLLILVLETNLVTAIVALECVIVSSISSLAIPTTTIQTTGGYVLGKLYSNCFMILLN